MKSKKSFFNHTIFRKNITLYWPIWLGYLLVCMYSLPFHLWMKMSGYYRNTYAVENGDNFKASYYLSAIAEGINLSYWSMVIFVMTLVVGITLFNYLFQSKSSNMIHAFPVDRRELLTTNVLSGFAFLMGPHFLAFLCSVMICISYGVTEVQHLGVWLLAVFAITLFFLAIVTLCAMMTGYAFALPVYVLGIHFAYVGIAYIIRMVIASFAYGVSMVGNSFCDKMLWLSPLYYIMNYVSFEAKLNQDYWVESLSYKNLVVLLAYIIVGIILFLVSDRLYEKRAHEKVGDILIFACIKPVFRWGIGLLGGFGLSATLMNMLDSAGFVVGVANLFVFFLLFGIACYILGQMLLEKSFHIFNKQLLKDGGAYAIALLLAFGGVFAGGNLMAGSLPEADAIEDGTMILSYSLPVDEQDYKLKEKVLSLQQMIIDHKKELQAELKRAKEDYTFVTFRYRMEEDYTVIRSYPIPYTGIGRDILAEISECEHEEDVYGKYLFGTCYDNPEPEDFYYGSIYIWGPEEIGRDISLTPNQVAALSQAIALEIKEGNIQKYNMFDPEKIWDYQNEQSYNCTIFFQRRGQSSETENGDVVYDSSSSVVIGPDCRHVIDALIKEGYIQSEDQLVLQGEMEDAPAGL